MSYEGNRLGCRLGLLRIAKDTSRCRRWLRPHRIACPCVCLANVCAIDCASEVWRVAHRLARIAMVKLEGVKHRTTSALRPTVALTRVGPRRETRDARSRRDGRRQN